jgi:thiamine-monophosphate kinase
MDEAHLIDVIKAAFGPLVAPGAYDFLDDAAMIPPVLGARSRVITTDMVVEGVDFDLQLYPAVYAGYRALAQNLSDLSAMGAWPTGFVWSLALPRTDVVADLARGAAILAKLRTAPLFGGDLSKTTGPIVISITAFGDVDGVPIRRKGARPGDAVYLTGPVGGSAAGLRALRGRTGPFEAWLRSLDEVTGTCVRAHLTPQPAEGHLLPATACIDVSDGLALDAHRLAHASGVRLDLETLPVMPGATRDDALFGGEDYALLFTASSRADGIRIGRVSEGEGVFLDGEPLAASGYDHFRSGIC